jgi:hypothetical protein
VLARSVDEQMAEKKLQLQKKYVNRRDQLLVSLREFDKDLLGKMGSKLDQMSHEKVIESYFYNITVDHLASLLEFHFDYLVNFDSNALSVRKILILRFYLFY